MTRSRGGLVVPSQRASTTLRTHEPSGAPRLRGSLPTPVCKSTIDQRTLTAPPSPAQPQMTAQEIAQNAVADLRIDRTRRR
jgi:hypothetical protein